MNICRANLSVPGVRSSKSAVTDVSSAIHTFKVRGSTLYQGQSLPETRPLLMEVQHV